MVERERTPACCTIYLVGEVDTLGVVSGSAQLGKVIVVLGGIARRAHKRGQGTASSVAKHKNSARVARQNRRVVAQVAHGSLKIGNAPGSASVEVGIGIGVVARGTPAKTCINVDNARIEVLLDVGARKGRRSLLRRERRRVDGHQKRCVVHGVVAHLNARSHRTNVGVTLARGLKVGTGHVDGEPLVGIAHWIEAVTQANLPVAIGVGVVVPSRRGKLESGKLAAIDSGGLGGLGLVGRVVAGTGRKRKSTCARGSREELPACKTVRCTVFILRHIPRLLSA